MGAYLQIAELPNYCSGRRLIQLADGASTESFGPPSTLSAETEAKFATAITDAELEVNGLLRGKYELSSLPATDVKRWVGEIAVWHLYGLKPEFTNVFQKKYDAARARLEAIRDSEEQLGGATPTPETQPVLTSHDREVGRTMTFGQGGLKRF